MKSLVQDPNKVLARKMSDKKRREIEAMIAENIIIEEIEPK